MASTTIAANPSHPVPALRPLRRRILRTLYHLLYNQLSWAYDTVAATVSTGYWHRWRCTALEHVQGQDILEIGCGPGHLLIEMVQRGYVCTALDASPAMLAHARTNLQRALGAKAEGVHLYEGRAQKLPFGDQSFDSVVMTFPAEFVREEETLHEVVRVLRPGGHLIIVEDAQLPLKRIMPKIMNWALVQTTSEAVNQYAIIPQERLRNVGMKGGWIATCGEFGIVRLMVATRELPAVGISYIAGNQ